MGVSGAVSQNQEYGLVLIHFPVRGATRHAEQQRLQRISIHAPREGSDSPDKSKSPERNYFNPRSPRGERQDLGKLIKTDRGISIHAPREGSDDPKLLLVGHIVNFNPRSPRGERLPLAFHPLKQGHITIHAPREGSDGSMSSYGPSSNGYFNPRSPRGERPSPC